MAYKNQRKNKLHIEELKNNPANFRYENLQRNRVKKRQKYLAILEIIKKKLENKKNKIQK